MDSLPAITLRPSVIAVQVPCVVAIIAGLGVLLCGLPWLAKGALISLLLVAGCWRPRQHEGMVSMAGCERGQWWVVVDGKRSTLALAGAPRVLTWLVVLHLRDSQTGAVHHLALWPDSTDAESLRRLRVFLRYMSG